MPVENVTININGSGVSTSSTSFQGDWNANTNTPTLDNTDTSKDGFMYKVSTGGSTDFGAGSITFEAGDIVINNGSVWSRIDATDAVLSVNGNTGVVVLDKSDVGLPNVDNTSDANKPVSTATQTALDGKSDELTIETKTSAYTLVNGDVDKQIRVTGTTTITLPESLTWGTNEGCEIVNVGSGTVTVATSGAVTVNGSTGDITLEAYESVVLMPISSDVYLGTGV